MGKTMAEKIISQHCGYEVSPGQLVVVDVDAVMASDSTAPLAVKAFNEMGGDKVWDPGKVYFFIDHASPSPNERISRIHDSVRKFAHAQNIHLYDMGTGVCHQVMVEQGHVSSGTIILGADSHTVTYGALGAFACGIGSTDLAGILLTGKTWLKVPESIEISIKGKPATGVFPKDIILYIIGKLTADGANYCAVEFTGEDLKDIDLSGRLTLCNMAVEMGAKTGMIALPGDESPWAPDDDAKYVKKLEFDISALEPQVAKPHAVDNVSPISHVEGIPIQQAFLGSCTNARIEDIRVATDILRGQKISSGVRFIVSPASAKVFAQAAREGLIEMLVEVGATIYPPSCGVCVGTHGGVPGDGENVISSSNRNFMGRMGNRQASIYLASPATVAASFITGKITDPRKYLGR